MIAVRIQEEVLGFLRKLPPQPRHALRVAIKALARESGDRRVITCVFAGPRKWIYEVFQSRLLE